MTVSTSFPAIQVRNLWQSHDWRFVLKDISFSVEPGEIAVLTGVNGVGKTTLLATIAGMVSATQGDTLVFGHARRRSIADEKAARSLTLYLPDDVWLPAEMSVREYLGAASQLLELDTAAAIHRIDALLALFCLDKVERHSLSKLSCGQKKKVGLCLALMADRKVLLLDEPFSGGLDPAGIVALRKVLLNHARTRHQTILLTTPVTEVVAELADRLLVLRDGQLAENLTRADLYRIAQSRHASISDTIEKIVFPQLEQQVAEYFSTPMA